MTSRLSHPIERNRRRAFTLVEMMVTMAISLILIFALAQAFAYVGENVTEGRAQIEMAGNLRSVSRRLFRDLDGLTVTVDPWTDEAADQGYFEYFEGVGTDLNPLPELLTVVGPRSVSTSYGDIDDVLAFTARSIGEPFRGFHQQQVTTPNGVSIVTVPVASYEAEIVWFTRFDDRDGDQLPGPGEVTLYRRVLLVLPNYSLQSPPRTPDVSGLLAHYKHSDISVRVAGGNLVPNSLADLTRRENRFAHRPNLFPFLLHRSMLIPRGTQLIANGTAGFANVDENLDGNVDEFWEQGWFGSDDVSDTNLLNVTAEYGNDTILTDLLAFDVKAFDPSAEIRQTAANESVVPGDPGWPAAALTGRGTFVDLGYLNTTTTLNDALLITDARKRPLPGAASIGVSVFSGLPAFTDVNGNGRWDSGGPERFLGIYNTTLNNYNPTFGVSYCTWSSHYERDNFDQNNNTIVDDATNGLDDPTGASGALNGLVDDALERETSPPYPVPLRGVQVRLRLLEPDTRQIREVRVVKNLTQE